MTQTPVIISRPETDEDYAIEIRIVGRAAHVFVSGKDEDEGNGSKLMKPWGLTRAEADLIDAAIGAANPLQPAKRRASNGLYSDPESQGNFGSW